MSSKVRLVGVLVVVLLLGVGAWVSQLESPRSPSDLWRRARWWVIKTRGHTVHHPAQATLKMIADGIVVKAFKEQVGDQPVDLDGALPGPVGLTPGERCCVQPDGRCRVDEATWSHPTWVAVKVSEPRPLCRYAVDRRQGGGWTARAVCDQDCDGDVAVMLVDVSLSREGELVMTPVYALDPSRLVE